MTTPSAVSSVFDSMGEVETADVTIEQAAKEPVSKEKKTGKKRGRRSDWDDDSDCDEESSDDDSSETSSSDFSDESDDSDFDNDEQPSPKKPAKKTIKTSTKKRKVKKSSSKPIKPVKDASMALKVECTAKSPLKPAKKARPSEAPKPKKAKTIKGADSKTVTINTLCSTTTIKALFQVLDGLVSDTSGSALLFGVIKPLISRFQNCIAETGSLDPSIFTNSIFMDLPKQMFQVRADCSKSAVMPSFADMASADTAKDKDLNKNMEALFAQSRNLRGPDSDVTKEVMLLEACGLALLSVYTMRQMSTSSALRSGSAEFHLIMPVDLVATPPLVAAADKHSGQQWVEAKKLVYDLETLLATPTQLANSCLLLERLCSKNLAISKMTTFFSTSNPAFVRCLCKHPLVNLFVTLFHYVYSRTTARATSAKVTLEEGEFSKPLSENAGEK